MTPEEIVNACLDKGVALRINPNGALTAIPKRKLSAELLRLLAENRTEVMQFVEERDGGGEELTIEAIPVDPPPVPMGQKIIDAAAKVGVLITLDIPSARGMMKIETEWDTSLEVPEASKDMVLPDSEYVSRQRRQVPSALAALINNYRDEIMIVLRAPYLPPPPPADTEPEKRSIWERMAYPDSLLPSAKDNQRKIRSLLYGDNVDDAMAQRRSAQLNSVLPLVLSASAPKGQ